MQLLVEPGSAAGGVAGQGTRPDAVRAVAEPAVTRCAVAASPLGDTTQAALGAQPRLVGSQPLYCPRRGVGPYGGPVHECMLLDALASSGAARLRLRYLSVRTVHARVLRLADTRQCAAALELYRATERGKVGRAAAFNATAEERYWTPRKDHHAAGSR